MLKTYWNWGEAITEANTMPTNILHISILEYMIYRLINKYITYFNIRVYDI